MIQVLELSLFCLHSPQLLRVSEDLQSQTPLRRLVAGGLAGTTSVIATYPLDLVRSVSFCHAVF